MVRRVNNDPKGNREVKLSKGGDGVVVVAQPQFDGDRRNMVAIALSQSTCVVLTVAVHQGTARCSASINTGGPNRRLNPLFEDKAVTSPGLGMPMGRDVVKYGIRIDGDSCVSRAHGLIHIRPDGTITIADTSTNGTLVSTLSGWPTGEMDVMKHHELPSDIRQAMAATALSQADAGRGL